MLGHRSKYLEVGEVIQSDATTGSKVCTVDRGKNKSTHIHVCYRGRTQTSLYSHGSGVASVLDDTSTVVYSNNNAGDTMNTRKAGNDEIREYGRETWNTIDVRMMMG